jgi:hypothetical protein
MLSILLRAYEEIKAAHLKKNIKKYGYKRGGEYANQ